MSNSIITKTIPGVNLKTQAEGEYNLPLGEAWEQILAEYLSSNGLKAYRACQRFVKAEDLRDRKQWLKFAKEGCYRLVSCDVKYKGQQHHRLDELEPDFKPHPEYRVLAGHPKEDGSLLRPHQRDVLVKISKVKRLSIEVKALTPSAFNRAYIQVGDCRKYDQKQFKVDAIVIINQATGEALVWTGDKAEMYRQRSANNDGTYSYAIEKAKLAPIDSWIDAVKDIYGLE